MFNNRFAAIINYYCSIKMVSSVDSKGKQRIFLDTKCWFFLWKTNHTLAQHCVLEQTALSQSLLLCFSQRDTHWENSEPKDEKCSASESRNAVSSHERKRRGREKRNSNLSDLILPHEDKTHNIIYITSKTLFLSKTSNIKTATSNKESIYLHLI